MPSTLGIVACAARDRGDRPGADLLGRVADQGRQERGGAEPAVRRRDRRNSLHGRLVIEQNVAAAVDLRVDETGREPGAGREPCAPAVPAANCCVLASRRSSVPSITTALSRCSAAPSKTWLAANGVTRRRSSGARDLLQVARLIDVHSAPGRETHQEARRSSGSGRPRRCRGDRCASAGKAPSGAATNTRAPF